MPTCPTGVGRITATLFWSYTTYQCYRCAEGGHTTWFGVTRACSSLIELLIWSDAYRPACAHPVARLCKETHCGKTRAVGWQSNAQQRWRVSWRAVLRNAVRSFWILLRLTPCANKASCVELAIPECGPVEILAVSHVASTWVQALNNVDLQLQA